MNRTQKFALNSLTAAISQIITMIAGLITPRLMIATYGSEVNGLVSSLNQFISYIALIEAGIGGAAIFSLYKPLAEKNHQGVSRVVSAARKSYRQAGYIFSSGIFILAVVYALMCNTQTLSIGKIFILTLILGVNGCVDFFLVSGYRVVLTADQRNYILSLVGIIHTILRTTFICILTFARINVVLLYVATTSLVAIKIIIIYFYSKKNYSYIDKTAKADKGALSKRWDVIYQQILGAVQMGAPTVIATIILDLFQVSVYSVYNMVLTGVNGILSIFISGLPAGFGELIAKGEKENLKKTVSEFETAYYYILSIVYGITLVMILPFINLYTRGLNDVNYYSVPLAITIVLNGLLYNVKTPQSMLIISAGMYKETRWRVTSQAIILIVGGVLFGIRFGLVGVLMGSCLSNIVRTIDLLYFTPKYITHTNRWKSVVRMAVVFVNMILIILPCLFFEIKAEDYLSWAIYAVVCGFYSVLVVTATTMIIDYKNFKSILNRVKGIAFRRIG